MRWDENGENCEFCPNSPKAKNLNQKPQLMVILPNSNCLGFAIANMESIETSCELAVLAAELVVLAVTVVGETCWC